MPGKFLKPASLLLVLLLAFAGCNTTDIYNDSAYNPPVYWGRHVVKSGETLSSIAWRYGRDYRELGNANGIDPPFHIKAGEVIRLDLRGKTPASTPNKSRAKVVTSAPSPRPSSPQKTANEPAPKVEKAPVKGTPLSDQSQTVAGIDWRWPHVGTVIASFSSSGKVNKGIDIAGNAGDAVLAAASGNVVYAGSGLLGYGNLIILNHNEHYLSAYAHNRKILVSEGDNVKGGQPIAELGSSGTERDKLHFEVRKNGNPVDPLPYLPPR